MYKNCFAIICWSQKWNLYLSPPCRTNLASLIERLQRNADKVEMTILETEKNLNKVRFNTSMLTAEDQTYTLTVLNKQ